MLATRGQAGGPTVSVLLSGPRDRLRAADFLQPPFRVDYANDLSFAPILRTMEDKHFLPVYSALTRAAAQHELVTEAPRLTQGRAFYDLAEDFRYSSMMGLMRAGQVMLHPPADTRLAADDALIFLKSRRDRLRLIRNMGRVAPATLDSTPSIEPRRVQSLLVIGERGRDGLLSQIEGLPQPPKVDCLAQYNLQQIAEHIADNAYDLVICLGEDGALTPQAMDAQLMPCLLYVRELLHGRQCYLCANLLDSGSVRYAYANEVVDYVLEDDRSRLIAADVLREEGQIPAIEQALFYAPQGLRLLPAMPLTGGRPMTVAALAAGLAARQMLLVGWLRPGADKPQVVLNPNKNEPAALGPDDLLIVV